MNFRKRILNPLFFFLNILAAIGFVFGLLAPFISPSSFSIFAFAATGFPLILLINVLFLIWWLVQLNRRLILPIVTLLLGYFAFARTYRTGETFQEIRDEDKLTIMTYNVRSFNRYAWLDEPDIPGQIADLIQEQKPDLILFQEYHRNQSFDLPEYPHRSFGDHNNGSIAGLAIYSKIPLFDAENLKLDDENQTTNLLRAKIAWRDQQIGIYNIHLASVGLEEAEYETLQNPDYEQGKNLKSGVKKIAGMLNKAYQRRAEQVLVLKTYLESDSTTKILGGDFNDVPQSYSYHKVNAYLKDSFIHGGGKGFGNSFARGPVPLRIDYLWHSQSLKSVNYHVPEKEFSDHFPLVVDIVPNP